MLKAKTAVKLTEKQSYICKNIKEVGKLIKAFAALGICNLEVYVPLNKTTQIVSSLKKNGYKVRSFMEDCEVNLLEIFWG
jgi:hypothetical protein